MAGLKFDIDDADVKRPLDDLADHAEHLEPAFMETGEMPLLSTECTLVCEGESAGCCASVVAKAIR